MLEVIDCKSNDAPQQFSASLKEIGFAVVRNHGVVQQLIDEAYAAWGKFFHSSEKNNYPFDPKTHDGLISLDLSETAKGHEIKDIKEFFHYYSWGRVPKSLEPLTKNLFNSLNHLAATLLGWVESALPVEVREKLSMPLSEMIIDSKHSLLRIIHYPPLSGDEIKGAVRAAPHEDINLLTLLPAATAKGLEVQDKAGQWLAVPHDPDWIIVNSGDMLQECSAGYYQATTHRVTNPKGAKARESRLSMPLFLHPRPEVELSDRHTAESYRQERFAELGLL